MRRVGSASLTVLALLLVWFALTGPNSLVDLTPGEFVQVPVEALLLVVLVLALPERVGRVVAVVAGVVLGLTTITKILDIGFMQALNRPFDSVVDWRYIGSAIGLVNDSHGRAAAVAAVVVVTLLVVAFLVLTPLAVLRLCRIVSRQPRISWRAVTAIGAAWLLLAVLGVHVDGVRTASAGATEYAYGQVTRIPAELRDQREFAHDAQVDPQADVPADRLLTGLRGKDVLFVFVESYGRSAVQGSSFAPGVDRVLDDGTRQLESAGFSSRSAFMTSPTFGAISWLAHSTLQSGLWVDSQERYDVLLTSKRLTLSRLFGRAGWRTVSDIPANTKDWPPGRFYGYDQYYDSRNVGYRGPRFGYPTMPDQFTLDAFHRLEQTTPHRRPVMAEIDLITSHYPWSRTPHMIDQASVGDGSVFDGMPEQAPSKTEIWSSPKRARQAYGEAIQYSLESLVSYLTTYGDKNTVVVFLGDHQPITAVSGVHADHDVPVSIVAKDPAVMDRVASWGWQDGLHPRPDAPVWRMDTFRDRFLRTFGP